MEGLVQCSVRSGDGCVAGWSGFGFSQRSFGGASVRLMRLFG